MSAPHVPARTNHLANEKSPYLLQHVGNPVDWYPWGDEAFARARAEDKPIFLSIGYSTCHWCHVMERESFENEDVAAVLNAHFVAVKVDREERPDVDRLYMTAMQALGQGGGWPLNVFLTPELEPFWGGTYFPPTAAMGRPGLLQILPRLAEVWREQRAEVAGTGGQVMSFLRTLSGPRGEASDAASLAAACAEFLSRQHDDVHGGFGGAPKFPSPANLHFLIRRWARRAPDGARALEMVRGQLEAMRANGIHDHLGGGFHRYATDRAWRIPHFEKMLYDQALLADACLDAYQATRDARWAETARGVFAYVARDLTSPEGAFWSAEDADSEGEEGRFYAWTPAQLAEALGAEAAPEAAPMFAHHYGVTERGNFEHGTTVLHQAHTLADTAQAFGRTEAAVAAALTEARTKLLAARSRRVRPHLDDKVITAWNGLMIAALAHGARALDEPELARRAANAADFIWSRLRRADGALLRRFRDGEAALPGQLDDHAYFARACLELYAATHEPRWLERAAAVTETMLARFWDDADGAFFESPGDANGIAIRMKDGYDGAELAGNSVATEVLLRLATLLERADWRVWAERSFGYHSRRLSDAPQAMPWMVSAMERAAAPPRHTVIVGPRERDDTRALIREFESRLRPDDDLVVVSDETRDVLSRLVSFAAKMPMRDGRATAYVCRDYACRLPVHEPAEMAALLQE
jgi:uncharacterized protein YyaL (SSP411 family)